MSTSDLRKLGLNSLAAWVGSATSASKRNVAKLEEFADKAFTRVNAEFKRQLATRSVNPERDAAGGEAANTIASGELRDSLHHSVTVTGRGKGTQIAIRLYSTSAHYAAIDDSEQRDPSDISPERVAEWLNQKFGIPNLWSGEAQKGKGIKGVTLTEIDTSDYPLAAAKGFHFHGAYRNLVLSIFFKIREREAEHFYQGLKLTEALRESLSVRRGKSGLVQRISEVIKSAYAFDSRRRTGSDDVPF